jgi:hypothetical protein
MMAPAAIQNDSVGSGESFVGLLPSDGIPPLCDGDVGGESDLQGESTALDYTDISTTPQHQLEERVQELEQKLATLALLFSKHRISNPVSPPAITPMASPTRHEDGSRYLALESPIYHPLHHRSSDGHRRNLSFRVLHSPDFPREDDRDLMQLGDSMFMPMPLPGSTENDSIAQSIEDMQGNRRESVGGMASPDIATQGIGTATENEKESEIEETAPLSPVEKADNVKSKWLDYLNSFQESNYDTDKQMEEFVKIPSAVEALLSYGFWICVDSFLYILTILPIRFVWSSLLLARFLVIRFFRREVPDGPFRFHRRYTQM